MATLLNNLEVQKKLTKQNLCDVLPGSGADIVAESVDVNYTEPMIKSSYLFEKMIEDQFKLAPIKRVKINGSDKHCCKLSLECSLKRLLNDKETYESIYSAKEQQNEQHNVYSSYRDGSIFKNRPIADALTIVLYSDAVQLTNALGASKNRHKQICVYFTVLELPEKYRGNIDAWFTAMVCTEKAVEDNKVEMYKVLIEELIALRTTGITLDNGKVIKFDCLFYTGDNLELNKLGGFQFHFQSGYPSRAKKIKIDQIRDPDFMLREIYNQEENRWTPEEYDRLIGRPHLGELTLPPSVSDIMANEIRDSSFLPQVQSLPSNNQQVSDACVTEDDIVSESLPTGENKFGLKEPCLLNILPSFHCVTNMPNDLMHDVLEGSLAEDTAEALNKLFKKKMLCIEEMNSIVKNYDYSEFEKNDKPDIELKYCTGKKALSMSLPFKACSSWIFMRNLSNYVPYEDENKGRN